MTIHTFYRPDSSMLNMLINTLVGAGEGVKAPHGHRFTAVLNDTGTTRAFAKVHEHERTTPPSYFQRTSQIEIGVSLSQITFEDFKRLANTGNGTNASQYFSVVRSLDNFKVEPTQVENLYVGQYGYYWLERVAYVGNEQMFVDLLKDFDFYYDYSDDLNVYKRYNNRWEEIKKEGSVMGLSLTRMNEIYRELSVR